MSTSAAMALFQIKMQIFGLAVISSGNRAYLYDVDDCFNRARYDDYCKIDFTLVGDILIASDNSRCGGTNVRFSGVYRRVRA